MTEYVDIVVIGGGIHGVGVAQAAAAAGYSVLVLEKNTLASGTSSRSSKLIHGGLRYLEHGEFTLVRECLRERALLLKLAPDLVRLVPFYIPVYESGVRSPSKIRMGLSLYALLGGLGKDARFSQLPRQVWNQLDGLTSHGLKAVFSYYDAQTDDAALTRAVMKSAGTLGARLHAPACFESATLTAEGVEVEYREGGVSQSCRARIMVNAAGPWANQVLEKVEPRQSLLNVALVQGTHVIVDGELNQGIYYLEAPQDQRAVFVMPWQGRIMVGTTETHYSGSPDRVEPLPEEEAYLFRVLCHYFPGYRGQVDISDAFAGLRVLPGGGGEAFSKPRETCLHLDRDRRPRLLTIYGGKLTAYRITAQKVLHQLRSSLPLRTARADTRQLVLPPAES